jgi:GTP pyrophosphokinase
MTTSSRTGLVKEWTSYEKKPGAFEKELREMLDILGTDEGISYRDMIAASGKKAIYTYTPKGDPIQLPKQSIVLDFAFKVHTEIGKHCTSAIIGQKQVGVDQVLQDGEKVQVITQKNEVYFEPEIQKLCQTPKARSELAKMFRTRRQAVTREIGRSIMSQEMKRYGLPFDILNKEGMDSILEYFSLRNNEELFEGIGEGRIRLKELIYEIKQGLYVDKQTLMPPTGNLNRIELNTLDPAIIKLSRCCNPSPTEKNLYGLLSERGLSIHNNNCETITSLKIQREDIVEVRWRLKETRVTKPQSLVILEAPSRNRVLMMLSVAPEEMKITDIELLSRLPSRTSAWQINFEVNNLHSLKNILNHFIKTGMHYEFGLEY